MSVPRTIVLSLGMPRSGTTLVQKMLEQGYGYAHQKVSEFHPWHPMNGPNLHLLVNTFHHKRVVVVHTQRVLEDVVESLRVGVEMGNPHTWTEAEVKDLYRAEKKNFRHFCKEFESLVDPSIDCRIVDFDYSDLGEKREKALRRIGNACPRTALNRFTWNEYLDQVWQKRAVNVGRLMQKADA